MQGWADERVAITGVCDPSYAGGSRCGARVTDGYARFLDGPNHYEDGPPNSTRRRGISLDLGFAPSVHGRTEAETGLSSRRGHVIEPTPTS